MVPAAPYRMKESAYKQLFDHYSFYLLRVPYFPVTYLSRIEGPLKEGMAQPNLFTRPDFLEALFLGSYELYSEYMKWLSGKSNLGGKDIFKLLQSVEKYFVRMCSRCTPYGLFAGYKAGIFGNSTSVILGARFNYKRHVHLDMNYLTRLSIYLQQLPEIKNSLLFFPNSSLYRVGDKIRYIESILAAHARSYILSSIDNSVYVEAVLLAAEKGAHRLKLIECISGEEIGQEEASDFLDALIASQLLVSVQSIFAQSGDSIKDNLAQQAVKALQPGDQLPDLALQGIVNTPRGKLQLRHYWEKGGLLILFWNTHCQYCVRELPALEKILADSKSAVRLLMVNDDDDSTTRRFLQKQRELTGFKTALSFVSSHSILNQLLPHETAPHFAWIDRTGKLCHITMGDPVTAANLADFSRGIALDLPNKESGEMRFNPVLPLFINGFGGDGKEMLHYTVFSRYIKHMAVVSGIAVDSAHSFGLMFNFPAKWMYQAAYNDYADNSAYIPDNRTVLDLVDTGKYVYAINGQPQTQNFFCYQRVMPRTDSKTVRRLMQEDMDKYWGLHGRIEKQKRVCWVLTAEDTSLVNATGGEQYYNYDPAGFRVEMRNTPIEELDRRLRGNMLGELPEPFVDETNIRGRVDIVFSDIVFNNPATIQKALEKYKMKLQKQERLVDILIISDH